MSTSKVAATLARVVETMPGGGELRTGQIEMADAVARSFRTGRHLVVRAGTGTGKSLAYLVPAVLSQKKVLIATATKALQDQLCQKDLPALQRALGRPLRYAVLKGRSNYLCMQRLNESAELSENESLFGKEGARRVTSRLAEQAAAVRAFAARSKSGDRAELEVEVDQRVWASFSTTAEECPGLYRCPSGGECFAERARAEAEAADIVIVNLHLLGADVANRHGLLPDYDCLVIDEAHETEDVMSAALGISLSPGRLRQAAQSVRAVAASENGLDRSCDELFELAEKLEVELLARVATRVRKGKDDELFDVVAGVARRLDRLAQQLSSLLEKGGARAARAHLFVGRLAEQVGRLAAPLEGDVAWVNEAANLSLELAPLELAPLLAEALFDERPVVLTSATVPLSIGQRLGAPLEATDVIEVESPFPYHERAVLYCAAHLPDRRREESERLAHDELEALISAAGGRTLGLFTSHRALHAAAEEMRRRLEVPILSQGELPKSVLIEAFSADPATCLFATLSFWQGVDVPGETLSLVVIDRLPFSRPDDPLLAARREAAGARAFFTIDLPRAASLLAQGAGRLVRTSEDRGVVAVLDPRLAQASYRWELVRALPPMRRTKVRAEAVEFLSEIAAAAPASSRSAR